MPGHWLLPRNTWDIGALALEVPSFVWNKAEECFSLVSLLDWKARVANNSEVPLPQPGPWGWKCLHVFMQFLLDPTACPVVTKAVQVSGDGVLSHLFYLTRTWCHSLHLKRRRLLKLFNIIWQAKHYSELSEYIPLFSHLTPVWKITKEPSEQIVPIVKLCLRFICLLLKKNTLNCFIRTTYSCCQTPVLKKFHISVNISNLLC